jgi:hypothetical protein
LDDRSNPPLQSELTGHCVMLIASPSDHLVYECFRSIASTSPCPVIREQLWLEGNVPLAPVLAQPIVPAAMRRVLAADCALISRIELEFPGLKIEYLRSGGHAPFKESFFDEVHLQAQGLAVSHEDLQEILARLIDTLQVATARAAGVFASSEHLLPSLSNDSPKRSHPETPA